MEVNPDVDPVELDFTDYPEPPVLEPVLEGIDGADEIRSVRFMFCTFLAILS